MKHLSELWQMVEARTVPVPGETFADLRSAVESLDALIDFKITQAGALDLNGVADAMLESAENVMRQLLARMATLPLPEQSVYAEAARRVLAQSIESAFIDALANLAAKTGRPYTPAKTTDRTH